MKETSPSKDPNLSNSFSSYVVEPTHLKKYALVKLDDFISPGRVEHTKSLSCHHLDSKSVTWIAILGRIPVLFTVRYLFGVTLRLKNKDPNSHIFFLRLPDEWMSSIKVCNASCSSARVTWWDEQRLPGCLGYIYKCIYIYIMYIYIYIFVYIYIGMKYYPGI